MLKLYRALFKDRVSNTAKCAPAVLRSFKNPYQEYYSSSSPQGREQCNHETDPYACPIEWLIYSTSCSKGLNRLATLLESTPGIKLTILGLGEGWRGWGKRMRAYHDYLTKVSPNAIVIITDGDDVLLTPGCDGRVLVENYLKREGMALSPIFMGSERLLYPDYTIGYKFMNKTSLVVRPKGVRNPRMNGRMKENTTQYRPPSPHVFLNAGLVMTQAKHIRHLIKSTYTDECVDDQLAFQKAFLSKPMVWQHDDQKQEGDQESAAELVSKVETSMQKEAEMELKYGRGSQQHLDAKEETYQAVKKKFAVESRAGTKMWNEMAGNWKVDRDVEEDETKGGLIPEHARPLIGLDYDNDLFANLYGYVIDMLEVDSDTKRVTMKQTGGKPCILHQSGRKVENRVLEELSGIFGLSWDADAVARSKEWQLAHPEEVAKWQEIFWKEEA
ncbi:hypothetical protein BDR26DRAFT_863008 [Obelidium mucronatum]|nr:hypothetical protein BDR26DRAFT_863008 [Obelidium mucronatum]